jgi:hydrogenase nickel incorporation protein HypA/HybF
MHELSIAAHVVETLETDLADKPGKILAVRLDVGVLSGVVPDALQFAWDVACDGTRFAGSELQIREIQAAVHCGKCDAVRTLPSIDRMRCPECGEWTPEVISGRELQIRAVEMSNEALAAAG